MAYVSGNAADLATLTAAIISACTSNGWTATAADVVSKGDAFMRITSDGANDRVVCRAGLGYSGGALTDPCAYDVYLDHPLADEAWSYPLAYEIHLHGSEVYIIVNWGTDKYSTLGFGQSGITGGPGKGVWVAGTANPSSTGASSGFFWETVGGEYTGGVHSFNSSTFNRYAVTGLFIASRYTTTPAESIGTYVHTGLPGWTDNTTTPLGTGGARQLTVIDNPSVNPTGQTVLVPIQPLISRGSNKFSIVADLVYARYVRLDTLNPGDIITFGADKWKVYPVYKRNATTRTPNAALVAHSGTYGYAIRYDGP